MHFINVAIFNVKYLAKHKVQMHAGATSNLLYSFVYVRATIHSLKLVGCLPIQTHKS